MAQVDVLNTSKKKTGTMELRDDVFGVTVNVALVHQVVKAQLASRRQGTAKTKTKAEVRGGGRKPFKQKGTGNARQGSTRSPLNPGGGQSFGPLPRDWSQRTPKEMVRGALRSILSDRMKSDRILVIDEFKLSERKTKLADKMLRQDLGAEKALIVDLPNENLELSARNLKGIRVLRVEGINVYDIVRHEWLILSQKAVKAIEERLAP